MKKITEFLFTSALKCISAYASEVAKEDGKVTLPSVLFGLADAITGNLVSEKVKAHLIYKNLQQQLKKGNPDNINHDLKKVFVETAGITFGFIANDYSRRLKKNAQEELGFENNLTAHELEKLRHFVEENKSAITEKINSYPFTESDIFTPDFLLTNVFDTIIKPGVTGLDSFHQYFESHFTLYFDLIFCELLKHNDAAFKGFQLWILRTILTNSNETNENVKEIKLALSTLDKGINVISPEYIQQHLDNHLVYLKKLETILNEEFKKVGVRMEELSAKLERNFHTEKILADLESKIHFLNIELEKNRQYILELERKQLANKENPDEQTDKEHQSYLLKKLSLEKEDKEARKEFEMMSYFNMAIFSCNTFHIEKKYKREIDELIITLTRFKDYLDEIEKIKHHEFYFQMVINLKNAYIASGKQNQVLGVMRNAYLFAKHILINYKAQRQFVIVCEHFYSASKEVLDASFFFNKRKNLNLIKDIYLDILKVTNDHPIDDENEKKYFEKFLANMKVFV